MGYIEALHGCGTNMTPDMEYRRANKLKAVFMFFFVREGYYKLAIDHSMAVNLEKDDLRKAYENGTFPSNEQKRHTGTDIRRATRQLSLKVLRSFFLAFVLVVAVVLSGVYSDSFHGLATMTMSTTMTFVGSFLIAWATLFGLGKVMETWSGEVLHEVIQPVIFQLLFIPGVFLALAGILW